MLPGPPSPPGPPPPLSIGGPPPPPIFGSGSSFIGVNPTKPRVIPNKKMKALFWDRILTNTDQGKDSVWCAIKEGEFDTHEFENMFAKREASATGRRLGSKKDTQDQPKTLMSSKLFQNLSIMLHKLPKPAKMQQAILDLDDNALTKDQISIIIQNLPTDEDVKQFKELYKTKVTKDFLEAEKYMLMTITIPEFGTRLMCWVFMKEFDTDFSTFFAPIELLKKSIQAVKNSDNFRVVLGYLLAMGNYLNGDTPKGQADGFHLKILAKLDTTRDKTNKVSLLQYAIEAAVKKQPRIVTLGDELKLVHQAKANSLESLQKGVIGINNGFDKFKSNVKKVKEHLDEDDTFIKTVTNFFNEAKRKCDQLQYDIQSLITSYRDLLKFFAYKDAEIDKTDTAEFFGIISEFVGKFEKGVESYKLDQMRNMKKRHTKGQTITHAGKGEDVMSKMVTKIKNDLLSA
jgi:hypothetical protein